MCTSAPPPHPMAALLSICPAEFVYELIPSLHPIEGISERLIAETRKQLKVVKEVSKVVDQCESLKEAEKAIRGLYPCLCNDESFIERLDKLPKDICDYEEFLAITDDLKAIAKSTFKKVYGSDDAMPANEVLFKYEVCYSYACKMECKVYPAICHYSNSPGKAQVVDAEIALCIAAANKKRRRD